jgi:hypothetical protein
LLGMSLLPCCRFHPAEVSVPYRSDFGISCNIPIKLLNEHYIGFYGNRECHSWGNQLDCHRHESFLEISARTRRVLMTSALKELIQKVRTVWSSNGA